MAETIFTFMGAFFGGAFVVQLPLSLLDYAISGRSSIGKNVFRLTFLFVMFVVSFLLWRIYQ